jgi:outer membrane protein TolC
VRFSVVILCVVAVSAASIRPAAAQTTNRFLGGVPSGTATPEPLPLSIADAIERALEHNLGLLAAEERVTRAQGARWRALSELLPNVSGRITETRQLVNLEAFGFARNFESFGFPPGAAFPSVVGPFNVFDARVNVSQPLFDLAALNDVRAERHNIAAAEHARKSARDVVVLVAANMYLQSLAAASRVESVQAQLRTAEAVHQQAVDLKAAGLVAGIDVIRAEVQLTGERQRATAANNEYEKAKLQLARVIGLPPGQVFTLSDQLPDVPAPDITFESALSRAYQTRPDYLEALERVHAAEASRRAVVGSALPSVRVDANFGELGLTPSTVRGTYSIVGAVTVPIFEGGRTHGRMIEADAELRERRNELEDLKAGIYYDVRTAFLDLQAAAEQLKVAGTGRTLAAQQLTQARDRFAAGVASNIEVVQAQEAVALASERYIAALYGHNVAKALLARGLGIAEGAVRLYLEGVR